MNARSDTSFQASIGTVLQEAVARWVARATADPTGAGRSTGWRWALAIVAVFVAWKAWRGFKSLFWTVFGLAMAVYWTGLWHRLF